MSAVSVALPARAENNGSETARVMLPHETLTGRVRSVGILQEEPGATPQANFYLDVASADGKVQAVLISLPAYRFACSEGEQAAIEGDFVAADSPFPAMLLSAQLLSCNGVKQR